MSQPPLADSAIFYVYEHWRPDKNAPFYVGAGKRGRAFNFISRTSSYKIIIAELASLGVRAEVRIVAEGLTQDKAFEIEKERIKFWRNTGVRLANVADGGKGPSKESAFSNAEKQERWRTKRNAEIEALRKTAAVAQTAAARLQAEIASLRTACQARVRELELTIALERKARLAAEARAKTVKPRIPVTTRNAIVKALHPDHAAHSSVKSREAALALFNADA